MSRRALLAALGLALLVLQMLAANPAGRHATGLAAGGATVSELCEPHADDRAPPPAREDHAPCCLLCAAGRDGPPLLPVGLEEDEAQPAAPPSSRLAYRGDDGSNGRPIGWASSWSSRAPPLA
ncbi:hypothetical protein [Methylosinus sp. Sm6]|uniref:hypothetical protein n=1 Tax=Methylosinus sp. Sm6 TaxID=2866948 RepID=UPI001C99142B|nr:hypothetical protein [Methylosinus sp. Sm6]MBY6241997.1 hypothetical protein [Methylosinus sp. Sm6]